MIPREILKKIRQIELRTNRLVSELVVLESFQSSSQFSRVARSVEYSYHADKIRLDVEKDAVALEGLEPGLADGFANELKPTRVLIDAPKDGINFGLELVTESGPLLVIPVGGFVVFPPSFGTEDYFSAHERRRPRRALRSARMVSQPMPVSGCRRSCSARASHLAISSAGNSSWRLEKNSLMPRMTLRRSAALRRRKCVRISVALTPKLYSPNPNRQAATCSALS